MNELDWKPWPNVIASRLFNGMPVPPDVPVTVRMRNGVIVKLGRADGDLWRKLAADIVAYAVDPGSENMPAQQPEPVQVLWHMGSRTYLAGPMSGLPQFNYPEFNRVAARLRGEGLNVENPAENAVPPCGSWRGYMRRAIAQLVKCDRIHLLNGWEKSAGALEEKRIAEMLGMTITFEPGPVLECSQ